MQRILNALLFLLVPLSSDALIPLIKDGGAREQGWENSVQYSGPLNYVLVIWLCGVAVAVMIAVREGKFKFARKQTAMTLLLLLSALSAAWSEYPRPSVRVASSMLASYLLLNIYIANYGWREAVKVVNCSALAILIASYIFIFFVPDFGVAVGPHEGKWQGVFTHKNSLGVFCALSYAFFLWQVLVDRKLVPLLACCMCLILLWGSQSGAATLACAIVSAAATVPGIRKGNAKSWHGLLCYLFLLSASSASIYLSVNDPDYTFMDKDGSLTGRNMIWLYMLGKIIDSPFLGQGLGQMGASIANDAGEAFAQIGFVAATAHNGFLEAAFSLGAVGLGLALLALLLLVLRSAPGSASTLSLLFVSAAIVINTFESELVGFNYVLVLWQLAGMVSGAAPRSMSRPKLDKYGD